ncbi:hypothetical protein OF83DRAFT_1050266 [Amylostereum chailletii]|nr:hypothetical protein OF83DRAFT_1050266 [Amylostereum chailletii]
MNNVSTPNSRHNELLKDPRNDASILSKGVDSTTSDKDIWKWATTAPDAIARCFVQDVFKMVEAGGEKTLYYLLGRIPCRKVQLVGTLVGIVPYEKRTVYMVDDGTGVIDCLLSHSSDDSKWQDIVPKPVADRGSTVKIVGNIHRQRNQRVIHSESICSCSSSAEELQHWRDVLRLHEIFYFIPAPFVVPSSTSLNPVNPSPFSVPPRTPKRPRAASRLSPTPTSTSESSPTPSPAKSTSIISLRRPAQLSSRELKPNTFKIYVKHYMDSVAFPMRRSTDDGWGCDQDLEPLSDTLNSLPATPTKRRRTGSDDWTPRPRRGYNIPSSSITPRASTSSCIRNPSSSVVVDEVNSMHGSTITQLRRVPDLSMLALRTVEARRREDSKKAKANGEDRASRLSRASMAQKMKHLFEWAVTQLLREGSIVIWNGPIHRADRDGDLDQIWKVGNNPRETNKSASLSRSRITSSQTLDILEDGLGDVSDPEDDEDSYVPLTTAFLAQEVEVSMRSFAMKNHHSIRSSGQNPIVPAVNRHHRPLSPTKEDIQHHIRGSDERWRFVTAWAIQEALNYLKAQDKVWRVSNRDGGRWELVHQ